MSKRISNNTGKKGMLNNKPKPLLGTGMIIGLIVSGVLIIGIILIIVWQTGGFDTKNPPPPTTPPPTTPPPPPPPPAGSTPTPGTSQSSTPTNKPTPAPTNKPTPAPTNKPTPTPSVDGSTTSEENNKVELLNLRNKLKTSNPILYGKWEGGNTIDFNCDKSIDDRIVNISGKHDDTGPRILQFKCKSNMKSPTYGDYDAGEIFDIDMSSDENKDTIYGRNDDWIRKIDDYGINKGEAWHFKCPDNEMIRGVKGTYGTSFNKLGFKCA
jgi:hypothetical protein